jgi:hypothetical protein
VGLGPCCWAHFANGDPPLCLGADVAKGLTSDVAGGFACRPARTHFSATPAALRRGLQPHFLGALSVVLLLAALLAAAQARPGLYIWLLRLLH